MNSHQEINVLEISKRLLFQYFPIWILYTLITSLLLKQDWGMIGFMSNFIGMLGIPVIMYLIAILPLILFKSMSLISRRICVVTVCLIIAGLNVYGFIHIPNVDFSFGEVSFLTQIRSGVMVNLSCAAIVSWFFIIEEKQYITEQNIIAEQNRRIDNEKKVTETYLKLLQAQIEPHFLFNTLTSILSLSDTDLRKAKIMHNNFMQYLKTTLSKTRSSVTTIAQEIELIKAYLDIFKVRMGKRLHYSVETDDEVSGLPFPSMLIQPIVENAIRHGLEPKIEGGEIHIQVKKIERNRIRWNIEDTGLGMSEKAHLGTGLSNAMERIEALYGKEGSLALKENQPSGVRVILEVPYV